MKKKVQKKNDIKWETDTQVYNVKGNGKRDEEDGKEWDKTTNWNRKSFLTR